MNIIKIFIKNITVFEDFELSFNEGINVIIGENGTGKTHLLKYIYALTKFIGNEDDTKIEIAKEFFNTEPSNLIKNNREDAELEIIYNEDQKLMYRLNKDTESKKYKENIIFGGYINLKTIFIPVKDMLSHSKGFLALNNKFNLPFDKRYIDIITNAELPEARQISKVHQKILDKLSQAIGGIVVYENDIFYILKNDNKKIEFSLESEGFRKLGLLYKLIRNGLIERDTILLWDNIEFNINPELIPLVVEILLDLQKEGVQIFISTHSYNLVKYFEIKKNDNVMFHNLYKTESGIKAQSNRYFDELENNAIIEADSRLLDDIIEKSMED